MSGFSLVESGYNGLGIGEGRPKPFHLSWQRLATGRAGGPQSLAQGAVRRAPWSVRGATFAAKWLAYAATDGRLKSDGHAW
jgi:hypothetical protein